MTNLVEITVKATDSSNYASIKANAAKAGAEAADAFNTAFKMKAGATISAKERMEQSGGLGGEDTALMNRLKSYANTPGGIGILGTGNDTSLVSMLKNQIRQLGESGGPGLLSGMGSGGTSSTDMIREVLENQVTGNTSTTDMIKQVLEGTGPSNTSTTDMVKEILQNNVTGNVSTKDFIDQVLEGSTPGNVTTKDTVKVETDSTDLDKDAKADADTYATSFASELKNKLSGLLSGGGKGGGSIVGGLLTGASEGGGDEGGDGALGAVSGTLNSGGVAGGALPGIAGVSGMAATVTGLAAALIAVLPAITAVAGGLGVIGGGFAILEETNAKFAADMKSTLGSLESVAEAAAAPLAKPLEEAATQIVGYFKQIEPDLKAMFADSATLVAPLVKGFEELMSGAGPGFLAMIKSAGPVFQSVAASFSDLGKDLGQMFQDFASDGTGSATILKAFMDLLGSLLPFIGELGKVMVSALAPAFAAFSSAISGVLPALDPLIRIIGSFAGAVLTDLASVLGAIGNLLVDLAPSFTMLAKVAANLFNTLENTGIFAVLGDVLESLAAPLAGLINALVRGLAPALPPIITAVGQVASLLAGQLGAALAEILIAITPIVSWVAKLTASLVVWLSKSGLLIPVLIAVVAAIDPVGTAVAAVGLAISELVTHWSTIWGEIKSIASSVGSFLDNLFHNEVVQYILAVETLGLAPLLEHWSAFYSAIKSTGADILNWFAAMPGEIEGYFKSANSWLSSEGGNIITGLWDGLKSVWNSVVSWFKGIPGDILDALGIHSPPDWAISAGQDILTGIVQPLETQAEGRIKAAGAAIAAAAKKAANAATGGALSSGSQNANESALEAAAAAHGWGYGTAQWAALFNVEMREAGFSLTATNPTSGAYGMAQFINGPSEYAEYGGNAQTAAGQSTAMINYIIQRYGTPEAAWAHEEAYGWYDQGGWLPTGKSIAVNNTGRPEMVVGPGGINVSLEMASGGQGAFDQFMSTWVKNYVRIKGGGNVQKAFGR